MVEWVCWSDGVNGVDDTHLVYVLVNGDMALATCLWLWVRVRLVLCMLDCGLWIAGRLECMNGWTGYHKSASLLWFMIMWAN